MATPARGELVVDGVSKAFGQGPGRVEALHAVSLRVHAGEFVCLVGPSGCGKSTLLDIMAGLTRPDAGRVEADGLAVEGPGRHRLVMFQESALFPWLDVLGNVMFGLNLVPELRRAQRVNTALHYLRMVKLERFARSNIHELSGGMRQRVALARALAPDPRVLLMDEPFSALDALTREQLYDDVQEIWQRGRKTVLLVTHDVREAVYLADRVVLLSPHPGRIHSVYAIDLPRPRGLNSPAVAARVGEITAALKGFHAPEVAE